MTPAKVFNIGDEVRTSASGLYLVIRDMAIHAGRTCYRVEATGSPSATEDGTWWVYHDELQPAKHR